MHELYQTNFFQQVDGWGLHKKQGNNKGRPFKELNKYETQRIFGFSRIQTKLA